MKQRDANDTLRLSPHVVWEEVAGEAVIVHMQREVAWVLNSTGTRIWRALAKGVSLSELAGGVVRECGELAAFVEQLLALGLLEGPALCPVGSIVELRALPDRGLVAEPRVSPAPAIKTRAPIIRQPGRLDPRSGGSTPWGRPRKK
jgi:hypothetical protein